MTSSHDPNAEQLSVRAAPRFASFEKVIIFRFRFLLDFVLLICSRTHVTQRASHRSIRAHLKVTEALYFGSRKMPGRAGVPSWNRRTLIGASPIDAVTIRNLQSTPTATFFSNQNLPKRALTKFKKLALSFFYWHFCRPVHALSSTNG